MERWNPFILKGLLTPGARRQQHLSMTAFNNMVIVLLIRVLLRIWHPCYELIEPHIIFWHIFYKIMTAINLITIIFPPLPCDFCLNKVCGRVLHSSWPCCHSCTLRHRGAVHDPNGSHRNGQLSRHPHSPAHCWATFFCSRKWYHY